MSRPPPAATPGGGRTLVHWKTPSSWVRDEQAPRALLALPGVRELQADAVRPDDRVLVFCPIRFAWRWRRLTRPGAGRLRMMHHTLDRLRAPDPADRYAWPRALRLLLAGLLRPETTCQRLLAEGMAGEVDADVRAALEAHPASVLILYDPWEVVDGYSPQVRAAQRRVASSLALAEDRVVLSVSDFRHAGQTVDDNPRCFSYDWPYLRAKVEVRPAGQLRRERAPRRAVAVLNRRGNGERFLCASLLFARHRERCVLSYLTAHFPARELARLPDLGVTRADHRRFREALPLMLDGDRDHIRWNSTVTVREYLEDAHVLVVFETNIEGPRSRVQQVSEKTYKGIRAGMPFMIFAAQPGLLAHLRAMGFHTFAPGIDESYDERLDPDPERDYRLRYARFVGEVERLCRLSDAELAAAAAAWAPSVAHNLATLRDPTRVPALPPALARGRAAFSRTTDAAHRPDEPPATEVTSRTPP